MPRIKQLDSLRAIAVILVILHHTPIAFNEMFLNKHPLGANLFMVLSGYLITSILLREKENAGRLGVNRLIVYRNFVVKRALRIFPLYFLVLLVIAMEGRTKPFFLLSLATFTANFYIYLKQEWISLSHTWSLSVQEHFYFLWPAVLLFTPRKKLIFVIIAFILTGIIVHKFIFLDEFAIVLTPACFDALGSGALLAWMFANEMLDFRKAYRWLCVGALVSLVVISISYCFDFKLILPFRTLYSIIVMWLIGYILHKGEQGILNKPFLLNSPVLHFIGRISFGLYLLHPVLPRFSAGYLDYVNRLLPEQLYQYKEVIVLTEQNLLLVAVAWLSYRFIEMPFFRLKKHCALKGAVQGKKTVSILKEPSRKEAAVTAGDYA